MQYKSDIKHSFMIEMHNELDKQNIFFGKNLTKAFLNV